MPNAARIHACGRRPRGRRSAGSRHRVGERREKARATRHAATRAAALAKFNGEALAAGRHDPRHGQAPRRSCPRCARRSASAHGELGREGEDAVGRTKRSSRSRARRQPRGEGVAARAPRRRALRLDMQEKAVEARRGGRIARAAAIARPRARAARRATAPLFRAVLPRQGSRGVRGGARLLRGAGDQRSEGTRLLNLRGGNTRHTERTRARRRQRLREAAPSRDGAWARLCSDDERVTFGDAVCVGSRASRATCSARSCGS